MMQNLKEVTPTPTLFLFCLTLDPLSKVINEQGHDISQQSISEISKK